MSGVDADGTPLNDDYSNGPGPKPKMKPSSPCNPPYDEDGKTGSRKFWFWTSAVMVMCFIALIVMVVMASGEMSKKAYHPDIVVAYTADQDVLDDGPIQLGYPYHRFSVTCDATGPTECVLEVQDKGSDVVSRFPYVEQEWFTPNRHNRPYHTLDVIKSLPSMHHNANLMFTRDPKANAALVRVMEQNGWIAESTAYNKIN